MALRDGVIVGILTAAQEIAVTVGLWTRTPALPTIAVAGPRLSPPGKPSMFKSASLLVLLGAGLLAAPAQARPSVPATHPGVEVVLDASASAPAGGRLLVFAIDAQAARAQAKDGKVEAVDTSPFRPTQTTVVAREVPRLRPGVAVTLDDSDLAFPAPLSQLPPGDYLLQAVLDVDHDYNYGGRGAGDLVSDVVPVHLPSAMPPRLQLARTLPGRGDPWTAVAGRLPPALQPHLEQARAHIEPIDFTSPALSAFRGEPVPMRGWVVLPPGYERGNQRYPTVYFTHGFGGRLDYLLANAATFYAGMAEGQFPPMIWVLLDQSGPTGTHEFADSVNNGPWGQALTAELIPALEARYRMDARPSGRLLTGHSSGGWATLWLQVRYPAVFGGTWSTAPDSSDFHDFTGADLYAAHANVYHRADGSVLPLVRNDGKVIATFQQFAQLERVLGAYGGQMASFEWVFSPRGADGRPLPMFDRDSGDVDPAVVAYWREHYDIAHRIERDWPALKPDLDGKIHVIVGTADTFYLDGAAHRLQAVLDGLGARSDFRFPEGRTHFDLLTVGEDRQGLLKQIAREMYAVARPGADDQAPPAGR